MGAQRVVTTATRYNILKIWLLLDYGTFTLDNLREINLYVIDFVIDVGLILFQPEISRIVARAKRDNVHFCALILRHEALQDLPDGVNAGPRAPINDWEHLLLTPRKMLDKLVRKVALALRVHLRS